MKTGFDNENRYKPETRENVSLGELFLILNRKKSFKQKPAQKSLKKKSFEKTETNVKLRKAF